MIYTIKITKAKTLKGYFKDKSKWCKDMFYVVNNKNQKIKYCLSGAVIDIYPKNKHKSILNKLESIIYKEFGHKRIIEFNDGFSTTFKDIQRIVRKAGV